MEIKTQDIPFNSQRLGLHYFPDHDHFGKKDIQRWLPLMQNLGIQWLTLQAPSNRAIPEDFLKELRLANIQPIIHLHLSLENPSTADDISPLLAAYAQRGVRYVAFFDRPNLRSSWPNVGWTQRKLVERFLEVFLPLAHAALEEGLTPLFPPLEPGGDYWDTAFLRAALEELQTRGEGLLLEQMGLSAYAWSEEKPLDWGSGGPESWPASLPYSTPDGSQDQRGFRIFDWYNAITRALVGKEMPLLVLAAGNNVNPNSISEDTNNRTIEMAKHLAQNVDHDNPSAYSVPENVLALNFWLLAAEGSGTNEQISWFDSHGNASEIVSEWQAWKENYSTAKYVDQKKIAKAPKEIKRSKNNFSHYLLLPTREWGASDMDFEAIKPFILKHQATVGYSVEEAEQASRVTLLGTEETYYEGLIHQLRQAGCQIDKFEVDGTIIATKRQNQ